MEFKILKKSKKSKARIGLLKTSHGSLFTPCFLPVASKGCVKTLTFQDLKKIGFKGIICNSYHLMLQPGSSLIKKIGGLHKFINFKGIIATDSGGFQIFSLGKGLSQGIGKIVKIFPEKKYPLKTKKYSQVKIREEGVYFKNHINGEKFFLSPEKSIKIQKELGGDIIFVLDECTSPFDNFLYTKKAMERTHRWAKRSLKEFKKSKRKHQALFGILQGGEYKNLRIQSAKFISSLEFDGFGIGGSLGKTKKKMFEILDWVIPFLPPEKPKHLLGIGYLEDFEKSVEKGIDLFDCAYPTRVARHGVFFSKKGVFNIKNTKFLNQNSPLDKNCSCWVCQNYSKNYIAHLFRAKELTALRLLSFHNLWFFKNFMDKIKEKIEKGKL